MEKAKFTKGDWKAVKTSSGASIYNEHGFLCSNNVIEVDDSRLEGESWLDMRVRTEPCRNEAHEESVANIYLMSVAPDMYELLSNMELHLGEESEADGMKDSIRGLLAKARGDTND